MNEPGPTPAFFAVLKSVSGRLSHFIIFTGNELGLMGRRSALQERDVVGSDQGAFWRLRLPELRKFVTPVTF